MCYVRSNIRGICSRIKKQNLNLARFRGRRNGGNAPRHGKRVHLSGWDLISACQRFLRRTEPGASRIGSHPDRSILRHVRVLFGYLPLAVRTRGSKTGLSFLALLYLLTSNAKRRCPFLRNHFWYIQSTIMPPQSQREADHQTLPRHDLKLFLQVQKLYDVRSSLCWLARPDRSVDRSTGIIGMR